jgi:hypothetical protein
VSIAAFRMDPNYIRPPHTRSGCGRDLSKVNEVISSPSQSLSGSGHHQHRPSCQDSRCKCAPVVPIGGCREGHRLECGPLYSRDPVDRECASETRKPLSFTQRQYIFFGPMTEDRNKQAEWPSTTYKYVSLPQSSVVFQRMFWSLIIAATSPQSS